MSIKSVRKDTLNKELAELNRQRNIAISLPLVGAAVPFLPLPITLAVAATAFWVLVLDRKQAEAEKPVVWDKSYTGTRSPTATFAVRPFLGVPCPGLSGNPRSRKSTT